MLSLDQLRLLIACPLIGVGILLGIAMILRGCLTVYVTPNGRGTKFNDLEAGQAGTGPWETPSRRTKSNFAR